VRFACAQVFGFSRSGNRAYQVVRNESGVFAMTRSIRSNVVLAAIVSLACAVSFAQSDGEATYKAKCQMCHGATGTPSPGMAKAMGVKPLSDPDIKKLTADDMIAAVKNGKGKMKPVAGLTDAQIKDAVTFYRGLK
jgi:mono/diheme cytochrome c family protein